MSRGSNGHEQCVTRCSACRLVHSPGRPASVITWKISTRDPDVTILGSQLTGLARLSYNGKDNFCCVYLRCRDICKASQPGSCNQALSSRASFYAHPLTSPIFQSLGGTHTEFRLPPPPTRHLHIPFSISNELLALSMFAPYKYYHYKLLLSKITEKKSKTGSLTTFKIQWNPVN